MNKIKEVYFKETNLLNNDQEMRILMEKHLYEEVYSQGTLDFEMREMITLAILCIDRGKDLISDHVRALLMYGTKPEVILEVCYQCIPYAGLLCVQEALDYVHKVLKEEGLVVNTSTMATTKEDTRFQAGFDKQCSVFPKEVIQKGHEEVSEDSKHIQKYLSAHCFGDFYTRKGLNMKQRELLTFCIIASLGGCENQLRAHTRANITAGNSRGTLITAITQCQTYIGFPRTLNALNIINEICPA